MNHTTPERATELDQLRTARNDAMRKAIEYAKDARYLFCSLPGFEISDTVIRDKIADESAILYHLERDQLCEVIRYEGLIREAEEKAKVLGAALQNANDPRVIAAKAENKSPVDLAGGGRFG